MTKLEPSGEHVKKNAASTKLAAFFHEPRFQRMKTKMNEINISNTR
jgi:hypothetical protein